MKKLLKPLLIIASIFAIVSCSSNQKYFSYTNPTNVIPEQSKVSIRNVNVNLTEKKLSSSSNSYSTPQYPNKKELGEMFKVMVIKQLKNDGIYSTASKDVFEFDVDVNYVRSFMAFSSDKYAGSSLEGYEIRVYKDNQLVASRRDGNKYIASFGLLGNLTKIGRTLSMSADRTDEAKEIETFANSIANDLKLLGK